MPRTTDPFVRSHARSVEEGERIIDAHFRNLARKAQSIVEEVGGDRPLRPDSVPVIMGRIDRELRKIMPTERGAGSVLESEIVANANRARVRAVKEATKPIARAIRADPDLSKAVKHAAVQRGD